MKYVLTAHAKERLRQRIGITAEEAMIAWVSDKIKSSSSQKRDGKLTIYLTESFQIVCDGAKIVTVKPSDSSNDYITKLSGVVAKEVSKLVTMHSRELRKAEIEVAQYTLNFLKAKSPKTKASIQAKLTEAIDCKAQIDDEIKAIEIAAKRYGVEV